ncbi:unnamed protein product [Meganyctiphanes norvegica]|uniref:Gustatory receptor n=1 Tax=Meganyctiphanes norvegica TaxID=48144 RepID=A0AAV2PK16_MEGNR
MDETYCNATMDNISKNKCFHILGTLDNLISIFVITPLVVAYWRGCWGLCDIYIYPSDIVMSTFLSTAIGIILGILLCVSAKTLEKIYIYEDHPFKYILLSRTYIFIYCFASINQWRGVWELWDQYTGISCESAIFSTALGVLLLLATRSFNNAMWAVPLYVCTDNSEEMYDIPTIFKKKNDKFQYQLLDVTYTVALVLNLIIFVWRGIWTLLDKLLFPSVKFYSALSSLFIGLILTCLGIMVQTVLGPWLKQVKYGFWKIIFEYIFYLISSVAVITTWRGYWYLLDVFLLPQNFLLSHITSFVMGIGVLMLLFCSNSIMDRGADMDSEDIGIEFQNEYLNVFYRKRLEKHILKLKNLKQADTL